MKATILFLLVSSLCRESRAFAPISTHSSRKIGGKLRPQHHVAYLQLPRLPLFLKRKEDTSSVTAEEILQNPNVVASSSPGVYTNVTVAASGAVEVAETKELTETEKLLKQVKDAGLAGVISYAAWELGFWFVSIPVVLFGYYEITGHFPDLSDKDDIAKLGAEAFAFVNFARFAVPLRIGLALSTTPWIQTNIVDRFLQKDQEDKQRPANGSNE